jgi:outer membrane protein TolC
MRRFFVTRSRTLVLLLALLCLPTQIFAQQQPADPHAGTHPPQPAQTPATHDTGFHPPYYEYPHGSRTPGHRSVSVGQAVELALRNASLYRQAELDERAGREDVRQARAAFLPQFSVPLTYVGNTTSQVRAPGDPVIYSFVSSSAINETAAFVSATGALDLSGRLRAALRRSRAQLAAARAGTLAARRALVVATVDAYYGLGLARQKRRLADETLALAEAFVKIAESLRARGEVEETDVLRARSAALLRRDELEQARAAESAAMDLLRALTGVDFGTHIAQPLLTNDLPSAADFADYTEELIKGRPELSQLDALKRAALEDAVAARRELWPELTYSLNGGFDAADFRPLSRYAGGQAIVSLNIPVFNWGASRSREAQAKLRAQSLDLQREATLQQLRQEFYTARAGALSAIERARMTRAATEASQQTLTLTFAAYRLKKGTILDVIDAQANYAAARLAHYQAIADYRTSRIRLEADPARMSRAGSSAPARPHAMTEAGRCALTRAQAPQVGGLRLGMTAGEAQGVVPSLNLRPADETGTVRATLRAAELRRDGPRAPYMEGVESVALEFTSGRLTYVRVNYPVTNVWESPDEFVAALAAKLNLKGAWKHFYDWESKDVRDTRELRDLALECAGFRLSAGIGVEGIGGDQTPHFEMEETR